jgi:hypothetical protein
MRCCGFKMPESRWDWQCESPAFDGDLPRAPHSGHRRCLRVSRARIAHRAWVWARGADGGAGTPLRSAELRVHQLPELPGDVPQLLQPHVSDEESTRILARPEGPAAALPDAPALGSHQCGTCGATIAQVSGKGGGYYGCLGAAKGACDNKMLVRRKLAERLILGALTKQLTRAEQIRHVLERVEAEVAKLSEHPRETIRSKESELTAEERRLANFVDFIGEVRPTQAPRPLGSGRVRVAWRRSRVVPSWKRSLWIRVILPTTRHEPEVLTPGRHAPPPHAAHVGTSGTT